METEDRRKQAKKRVEELKGFYIHLAVYIVVNLLIVLTIMYQLSSEGRSMFGWPMLVTPLFWGIGLGIHAVNVFGFGLVLGKNWEERMIRKYMEDDRKEAEKYRNKL